MYLLKIKRIYKIIPIPIFVVPNKTLRLDAKSYGLFILIEEENKNDEGLIVHELTHCKQFYRTFGLHNVLYSISKEYRFRAEYEAYTTQYKYDNIKYSKNAMKTMIKSLYQ